MTAPSLLAYATILILALAWWARRRRDRSRAAALAVLFDAERRRLNIQRDNLAWQLGHANARLQKTVDDRDKALTVLFDQHAKLDAERHHAVYEATALADERDAAVTLAWVALLAANALAADNATKAAELAMHERTNEAVGELLLAHARAEVER